MPCHHLISDQEITNTYKFKGLIQDLKLIGSCPQNNASEKKVFITELVSNGRGNLLHQPIERTYREQEELYSKEGLRGKVAHHEYFILKSQFRGLGTMSKLHKKELATYKKLEFDEIQLLAAWDGLIVWKKLGYQFASPKEANKAIVFIQRYLREERNLSQEQIHDIISNNPFTIDKDYLRESGSIRSFMDWVHSLRKGFKGCSKMYKEIQR